MNKIELNQALSFVFKPKGELQIIFYAVAEGYSQPVKLDIENDALPSLLESFIISIKTNILDKEEYSVINLSTADERGNCFYQYDLELPEELKILETVIGNDSLEKFNFKSNKLSNIRSLVIVIADQEKELSLFKNISPVEVLGRGGFVFKGASERLEKYNDQLLRITPKFQIIRISNELIINDLKAIEKSFGFHDVITREAINSVNEINSMQLISNIDSLTDLVTNISFARKLTKIARNSPVIKLNISNEQIISFAKSHPLTKSKMRFTEDGLQFTLDTRVSKNLFIKILNDDLLTSELTKLYYDSLAKDDIVTEDEE